MYAMVGTKADFAIVVSLVGQVMCEPKFMLTSTLNLIIYLLQGFELLLEFLKYKKSEF